MPNNIQMQYKFFNGKSEAIYSLKHMVTSKMLPIGYQMFNLISSEMEEIREALNAAKSLSLNKIKNVYDTLEYSDNADIIEYFFMPEIFLNIGDCSEIEKSIVFIKYFFESVDINTLTLETFLAVLTEFNLRIPCYSSYRITKDYTDIDLFAKKSCEEFSGHIKAILASLEIGDDKQTTYFCDNLLDILIACVHDILKNGYSIKRCAVCNCLFVPSRSDTLYCDRTSPNDKKKTCKEYGAYQAHREKLKKDEPMKLYRNIYMAKQNRVLRNPNYPTFAKDFENFKVSAKKWKSDLKSGIADEKDYLEWLSKVKQRN